MNRILFTIWRFIKNEIYPVLTISRILAHLSLLPFGILFIKYFAYFILPSGNFSWPSYIFDGILFLLVRIYSWIYETIRIVSDFVGVEFNYRFSFYPMKTYITALLFLIFIIPHIVLWMYWKKYYKNFWIMMAIYLLIPCIGLWHTHYCKTGYAQLLNLYHSKERDAIFPMRAETFHKKFGNPVFWNHEKGNDWEGYYLDNVCFVRVACHQDHTILLTGAGNWPD